MKLLILSLFALSAFAADAPLIDPAIQIEVLATQYDLAIAKLTAAPYDLAVTQKQTAAQPAMDKAAKACGTGYEPGLREGKVICIASPHAPVPMKPAPAPQPDTAKLPK